MEDEERRRKLEAGKAMLAEYRQRKAQSDGQKKKKKKKNKGSEPQEGEQEECAERRDLPSTEFSFSRTLCSGETVKHEQTFTVEPESEITTTAEDYSSEVNGHVTAENPPDSREEEEEEEIFSTSRLEKMENELTAKSMAVDELGQELETIKATFGAEGVQQLQEFEAALKHRDGIITQLTSNLQQARAEKDEVMREFLDLTEKSQKLQIQFQQLQAGESLRSSSISSAAADLLQTRQQVLLYQKQLDEKDVTVMNLRLQLEKKEEKIMSLTEETDKKVKHLQEQLEESVNKITSLHEQISEMTQIQKRMSDLETTFRDTEISFTQRLQEKDLQIEEQERLILEHRQSLSQLQDKLQESEKRFINVSEQLEAKVHDLQGCEAELQASKEKEQLSSGEILQLMGTVEALQKHYHQGSRLESEVLQRAELETVQRLDHLRAELDEMYGQQIVQMKQELVARHKEEMANILNRHSTELRNVSDQHCIRTEKLTSQLTQSSGDVNALNVRVIELQQRLQEVQVLRERAEHDLAQMSEEKILLQTQVQHLMEDLHLKEQEKSQSEVHLQLTATITDLRAQLASVQEASTELKAKHESEITNYQIKLEMLEREKDAVLDRMAESQEAELERLRTQLLFSHEEELRRLRQDLQHESQMNVQNLRDELNQRHQESVQQLCNGYEERIRAAEEQRLLLSAERSSLLQEIVTLKNDLNQALENSQVEELVSQLKSLQAEIQELRQRDKEDEPHELHKHEVTEERWRELESENKQLKETKVALMEELMSFQEDHKMLTEKMDSLISENRQANDLSEKLRAEIERQKSTFSFAEKNFEVNYQELRAELEERLRVQVLQYEAKLQDHETQLQSLNSQKKPGSIQSVREKDEEPDGEALVEKETTELMEKLQNVELERQELEKQVEQNESEIKELKLKCVKLEELMNSKDTELRRVQHEKTGLSEQVEQKEAQLHIMVQERAGLVEQLGQKEAALERSQLGRVELEEQTELKDLQLKEMELEKEDLVQQVERKEAELDKINLERVELVQQVEQKTVMLQQQEAELQKLKLEKAKLVKQLDKKEAGLQKKKTELPRVTIKDTPLQVVEEKDVKKEALQRLEAGKAELKEQLLEKKAGLKAAKKSRQKGSRVKSSELKLETGKKSQVKIREEGLLDEGAGQTGQRLAPPLSPAAEEEKRQSETHVRVVHRNDDVKQQTQTHKTAAEETHSRSHSRSHTRAHTRTHTQPAAAASHTAKENKLKSVSERQVECHYGETDLVPTLTGDMEGCEHEECRLQLEAQRISLSQIHAAQLELLKERLPEWEEPERQGVAKASVCSSSLISITQDFTRLLQLITGVCGVDSVDVTEEQLQNLQPRTIREILDKTQELYQKLRQLDTTVLSCATKSTVCDDLSARTDDDIHSSTLTDLQERVKEQLDLQGEVKEQMDLQEKVKEQMDLQEKVKEQMDLQEEKHRQEIERLRSYFSEQIREMEERYTKEVLHLQDRLKDLKPMETLHSMAGISAEEQHLQMRQYEMEEEIARVIVQMSVEFARQSEMSRVSVQEETRDRAEPERGIQMTDESWGGGVEWWNPSMQCSSTRTEQLSRSESEDEERKRKDKQCEKEEVTVTSQLTSTETQERVHQVLMDLLKMAALTEETVRDESILSAADEPETGKLSLLSGATDTDEGLDVCWEAGLAVERAGSLWGVCSRLQKTVEKLIITLTSTHTQLDHARLTQTELMKEKFTYDQQITDLLNRQEELQRRLEEERTAREKLTLQLHHAEGLIDGYSDERRALEEQVREGAGRQQQLEAELQVTNSRLQELHQERKEVTRQKDLLLRQQDAVIGGATEAELSLVEAAVDDAPAAGLLEETEKLLQEKVDVQRQAQKDHTELLEQVKHLEAELNEQVRSTVKMEETHQSVTSDLHQQIHALEKQLENNRRFLDEQAADREQERDVFQQEIQKLEQQLKSSSKTQAEHREVERLSVALQEKADWCSELSLRVQQLQRDVQERNEEIERQEERVRVLEEVLVSHDNHHITSAVEDSKQYASMEGGADATLESLLQTEREALDRKEKEIVNLEEQLEQFRDELQNKSEEVQQLHMQLEIQKKEISTQQQDLQTHTRLKTVLEEKNRQIALLNEQIDKLQPPEPPKPEVKEVEVKNQLVCDLESQVEYLRGEQDRLKRGSEEEVEQLNSVIEKLQQELSNIEHKQSVQEEDNDEEDQKDELKLKIDQIQRELDTLKEEHFLLVSKYGLLQEERETKEEKEKKNEMLVHELEDMLRDKMAALVVAQVQIQALGESANSIVSGLTQRVEQLQTCLEEREDELRECRSKGDEAKSEAGTLRLKVSQLEEKLKQKVAILSQMVNQKHCETDIQTKCEIRSRTSLDDELEIKHAETLSDSIGGKEMDLTQQYQENDGKEWKFEVISEDKKEINLIKPDSALIASGSEMQVKQCAVNAMENVLFLIKKLRKLEVDLCSMPKDQELQKHLLASSEEDIKEYEKMLTKLMKILDQMKSTPSSPAGIESGHVTETEKLYQKLQQARNQSAAANEHLDSCKIQNLQEQIQFKDELLEKIREDLRRASERSSEDSTVIVALHQELHEVKCQSEATEKELNSCKELSQRLQEQIEEQEKMISMLKDQMHKTTDEAERSELIQELQHIKLQTAANEEELNNYKEQNLKLQEQIQVCDASVVQLMEELQHHRTALNKSGEEKHSRSHRNTGQDDGKIMSDRAARQQDSLSPSSSLPAVPSADRAQCISTGEVGTQVEGAELGAGLEEVIGEYTQRIGQIRELHAAEIMDMENRHITESESLKNENRRLEQECVTLREGIDQLHPLQVMRPDHSTFSVYRDGYTSDSSSDVGTEYRSTPEGARPDDAHLPDRLKSLLREVHQEGMQVLSLSELSVCDESADHSSLLAQITHLQAQLTQLRQDTHTNQQLHTTPTETDRQVEQCDRLRAELAQVRLELKTSLKTQHTHKRELDTLRAEVCVKVSELDAVSERLAEEQRRARELQWEVERERSRTDRRTEGQREEQEDMKLALEEERLVLAQKETELAKYTGLVKQLQVQLESQNSRLKEMRSDLQKEKELNAELLKHAQHPLQVGDGVPSVADSMLQSLQVQLEKKQTTLMELRAQAEEKMLQELEQKQQWQDERRHLQRQVDELQSLLEGEKERGKATERERMRLEGRVSQMMERSSTSEQVSMQDSEQKSYKSVSLDSTGTPVLNIAGVTCSRDTESVVAKLQKMSSKISRFAVEGADDESFSWLLKSIQEVISFLQKYSSVPPVGPESAAQLTGGVSSVLSERLLHQNAELTGFVSRLTEEKNEQRNQILRLEEELRRQRHLKAHNSLGFGSEVPGGVLEVQKELWMREKSKMEKSLLQAEAEISRLRADIRADVVRDLNTSDADNATLKRIYGKYLRSESFRKALIYQKKYLLLLLGGFQECEEATLSLIAGMASPHVHTHTTFLECISQRRRGYSRFRSAARACIALFRMRFLVRRWQKVTGGSTTIIRNGVGQSQVIEVRTDSPYLQPRGTTRGRTGRESPHTTHTTHHRYGGIVTDGGVVCSHLQSYDPDRALSDYITRLEALQRRLGSVQSGSSSYTQMHFGLRR